MPTPAQILEGLRVIANQWQMLAIAWHLFFAILATGLLMGVRPSKRIGAVLLSLPLLSVSALAWVAGNPFNGSVFVLAAIALLLIASRMPNEQIEFAPAWLMSLGVILFAFGWTYPHFLETDSFLPYLYAAPTGLIPCPTLAILIGLSLIVDGFESRAWSLVLGGMGVLYGLVGVLQLGITIDWMLFLGALLMIIIAFLPTTGTSRQALAH